MILFSFLRRGIFRSTTFQRNKVGAGHFGAGQNWHRSKSAQKKNEPTWLYSALIKNKFVCKVNSFAFNGNSLHWEYDCIFALPLRLSVNHYYKQAISTQITIKYCITLFACQQSPAASTCSLVFFISCENKLHHYKQSRDM